MVRHPTAMLARLRQLCPDLCVGVAGRGVLLRHLQTMSQIPLNASLAGVAWEMASWRRHLLPWDHQTTILHQSFGAQAGIHTAHIWEPRQCIPSENFTRSMQAIASGDIEGLTHLWRKQSPKSITNPAWIGEACLFALQKGARDLVEMILENHGLDQNHPVILHLRALRAFCLEPAETALAHIALLPDDFSRLRSYLHAEVLLRNGDTQGVGNLAALWRDMPWHVNLTLKLHDLLLPSFPPQRPDSNTAVCIYSWNNADLLRATLTCLAQSDLGRAGLVVLDNGSSDHTPKVIQSTAPLFGERIKSFRLPVNIGAPAARNWLLRHPDVSTFRDIVFLDDDVLLSPDWLSTLLATREKFSRNAVLGCRITDRPPRASMQMADVNLLDFEADGDFQIANAGGGELDLGLHEYTRPCLSVTGCCHLVDRRRAEELGGFDLRFTPSQFDDFDLDLRNALQGGHAIYCGRVGVRHCQRSSLGQADNEAKQGHIQGNMLKLNTKYSTMQKAELLRRNRELLWEDLLAKTTDLEEA